MTGADDPLERLLARARAEAAADPPLRGLRDEFRALALSGFFRDWVNRHLAELLRDPHQAGLWFWPEFTIRRIESLSLAVAAISSSPAIHTHPGPALYIPLGGPLRCERYRLPPHANELFDPAIALEHTGSTTVEPGEVLEIRPEQVYDLHPKTPGEVAVAAMLSAPATARFKWSFDRRTLKALEATDADAADMQLRAACKLLGELGDPSSLQILEGLAGHANHGVRWTAIQNLARIDPAAGHQWLQRALADSHPHIRAAATKTLQRQAAS